MIKYFLILALALSLNAAKILSYNIYDRTDRVDVMITFDTPYDGIIKQSITKSKIIIKLQDASIESEKTKELASPFLNVLSITPMADYTIVAASVPLATKLKASKTSDGYGLRLRFTKNNTTKTNNQSKTQENNPFAALPTKRDAGMQKNYYIVVSILIIGILILFFIKKKVTPGKKEKQQNSWLFKANANDESEKNSNHASSFTENVSIRFQKNINEENSVVMLDFGQQSYLVLMGKNNILLDKFTDNKPETQEDFETILQNRHQELDDFIRVENTTTRTSPKEPLQAYKERAASIIYES
jgi:hypothetical protein